MLRTIIIALGLIPLVCCSGGKQAEYILFDFESEAELDRLYWSCHTLMSVSDEHVAHGQKALKLELFPSDYPGFIPKLGINDWSGYKAFCFDILEFEIWVLFVSCIYKSMIITTKDGKCFDTQADLTAPERHILQKLFLWETMASSIQEFREKKEDALFRGWNNAGPVSESQALKSIINELERKVTERLKNKA